MSLFERGRHSGPTQLTWTNPVSCMKANPTNQCREGAGLKQQCSEEGMDETGVVILLSVQFQNEGCDITDILNACHR